jgi:hypothetical protein
MLYMIWKHGATAVGPIKSLNTALPSGVIVTFSPFNEMKTSSASVKAGHL